MALTVLQLQVLVLVLVVVLNLVLPASASHYMSARSTYHILGVDHRGNQMVKVRTRQGFSSCGHSLYLFCSGNCGRETEIQRGTIDSSFNAPPHISQWCETETVTTRIMSSDRPFSLSSHSCCWIRTATHFSSWNVLVPVDLGTRSDTSRPNRPPLVSGLPFIRIPQNCPRTYKLLAFDPDEDRVRCRYGNQRHWECAACRRHSGFVLDEDTCTLRYENTYSSSKVRGFEMMVEDFPRSHVILSYSDGSRAYRFPLPASKSGQDRHRRWVSSTPWWQRPTTATTQRPTTAALWWQRSTIAAPWWQRPTTTAPQRPTTGWPRPATTAPWWQRQTTTARVTTSSSRLVRFNGTTASAIITPPSFIDPLSKLPLQFSFLVDPPVQSCQEGVFLPRLVYPTPHNGAAFQAEVNKEMEFRVRAEATSARINDILLSGPLNISESQNTHNEFVVRWTPIQEDLGQHFPICFAVESVGSLSGSAKQLGHYHSEMRCVRVEVVPARVITNVICSESLMRVEVEKTEYFGNNQDHFELNNAANTACQVNSNRTHIFVDVPLNSCGTQIEEDENFLYFKNEITTVDNASSLITRMHELEVQFQCQYPKNGNVSLGFTAHRDSVTVMEKGFGTFTYQSEFYPDSGFHSMIDPSQYPLEFDVGNEIFMQIQATSSINNTRLFVESCRAAPYDIPNYTPTYTIFENGCKVDPTIEIYPPEHNRQFRFSMEAFQFIGQHDQVYISCSVMMCEDGNPNTRCARGCQKSGRGKREAVSESSLHFISQGPLRLKRSAGLNEGSAMTTNLNLNLVFITGCLLAVVAMASAVFMYRAKMSKVKYQPLPTSET
ncbi:uncharacterized protein LOC142882803 [Nelusetta ayraudi]|uniref:uncharacterized protein LOC142882803 n=1 Tax=Nelusetta ayraudi TaxID=303726 RepID=UPI003F72C47D